MWMLGRVDRLDQAGEGEGELGSDDAERRAEHELSSAALSPVRRGERVHGGALVEAVVGQGEDPSGQGACGAG